MLSLTKKSEYALIAICHLARVGERVVSAREIAELHQVPLPLLMNILKQLNQAGCVNSVRGARGGYSLAVPAETLTLSAVLRAVEGPVRLVNCAPVGTGSRVCERAGICSIRSPIHKLHHQFLRFLDEVTVSDVAFDEAYYERPVGMNGEAAVTE
ncbi:MAG TPA: Rrf2 family transcriptional regulator [Phycisphaerae bacterium]|jgi:Rrf2 family protein|nr:Rrf2 family transcriptional regulator [Phycisphaerae bacterium]HRS27024.1 Rrf2 family transcriptional regulator [Phycisphaerae bacterium]HRT42131.1 Rrf2 family transcriptional regulator [Phycisphaerae bacterium]